MAPLTAEQALIRRLSILLDPRKLRTSEHTFLLVLSALVGMYGGLAAGLFTTTISVLRIGFFRTHELIDLLKGDPLDTSRLHAALAATRWHPGYLVFGLFSGLVLLTYGLILRGRSRGKLGNRVVTIATVGGAGVLLYYSLLVLGAVDRSFPHQHGELLALVEHSPKWLVVLVPTLGGLIVGILVERFSPEARGHGVTEVLEAMAIHQSRIPAKTALFKGLTASVTIASGGSVGREGPVVQIGSAVGSSIGQKLGVSRSQLRTLIGCGAAAGISASFDAPIAGAMFALEIILADFGISTFSPIVLSAVVATVVSRALYNTAHVPTGDISLAATSMSQLPREMVQATYKLASSFEIGPYLILGFICGIVSIAFIASLDRAEGLFNGHWGGALGRWLGALPAWMKPAVGGLILGCLGLLVPRMLGTGYETMNATLKGELATGLVIAVLAMKIIGTSLTLGSGGSGGSFFPSVFIGAMTGSAFGGIIHRMFPTLTATSGAYALVGMGAVVAGATQAPLTGIIMMFELTGDYQIILPLMVACLSASLLVDRWLGQSIYTLKLAHKGINPRAGREIEVLRRIPVRAAMTRSVPFIPRSMPFKELLGLLSSTPHVTYVVVDDQSRYLGIITLQDVREFFFEEGLSELVVAGDLARTDVKPLAEDEDLQVGLERLAPLETDLLPVASTEDSTRIVGMLSRRAILLAYQDPQRAMASV